MSVKYLGQKRLLIGILIGIVNSVVGWGQTPLGDEFRINSDYLANRPSSSLGSDSEGNFVVVWDRFALGSYPNPPSLSIRGQRFLPSGAPVGAEFQVSSEDSYYHVFPSLAVSSEGWFSVVWFSFQPLEDNSYATRIHGLRFSSDGTPLGKEFRVSSSTSRYETYPSIGVNSQGDFTVVWESDGFFGPYLSSQRILGRRYASDGLPIGGEFQVNSATTETIGGPTLGVGPLDSFVVVWESEGASVSNSWNRNIQARRFSYDGSPRGGQFRVNSYTTSFQRAPSIGVGAKGDFVVTWTSNGSFGNDSSSTSIQGRRFDSAGQSLGVDFQVNSYTSSEQSQSFVQMDLASGFLASWISRGSWETEPSPSSVQVRRFKSNGLPLDQEFQANSSFAVFHNEPALEVLPTSEFLVIWSRTFGIPPIPSYSLEGQLFSCSGTGCVVFSDGFESGDFSRWSVSHP